MATEEEFQALREEILRLVGAAAASDAAHAAAMQRSDDLHEAAMKQATAIHDEEIVELELGHHRALLDASDAHARRELEAEQTHVVKIGNLERALESRDRIGQAKGILMVMLRCDAAHAFEILRKQSQHENRKLTDVADEVVLRAERRPVRPVS